MKDNFSPSLSHVLRSEGGYVNDGQDPGGATNCGITQAVYDAWRAAHGQPTRDVRAIDPNEIEAIYRQNYWDAVRGDDLPAGVDYCAFDAAVNSGVHRAAVWLQRAAQVVDDGYMGPVTLAAVHSADPRRIINAICSQRLAFLETLPTWPHFGRGWSVRVAGLEQDARGMAA